MMVVMDNCPIHHVQEVADLLNSPGNLLIFLPLYSSDFNPIEPLPQGSQGYPAYCSSYTTYTCSISVSMCNSWIDHRGY